MDTLDKDYELLLRKQKEFEPFFPLRLMAETMNVSLRTANKRAKKLVERGLAEEVDFMDGRKHYRMIERKA